MKQYKVISVNENPEVLDLVNTNNVLDRFMCAPDEFEINQIISETDFYLEEANMVDDQGYGVGLFAFKKLSKK
jgi:hypothetical protein